MIKKTFCDLANKYELIQYALVDIALDAPKFLRKIANRILEHSESGQGALEDMQIYRKIGNRIRVHHAVEMLQDAGLQPRVDRVDNYCIWIGDDCISFLFDVMNGEPYHHPQWVKTNERNVDGLVDKREVESLINKHNARKNNGSDLQPMRVEGLQAGLH